jgi:hypothetical protein
LNLVLPIATDGPVPEQNPEGDTRASFNHDTHGGAAGVATENKKVIDMERHASQTGYASVNGLKMYDEIHGPKNR